ncbi:MAG: thioredoxin domain-containing protein [Acidobacteria bacterium]|nr:thioredoxin domain-containing protein [Acidobacteriota bacterium]MBS1865047.1 thioredoxin domain-containing protein [Acidobacteriota bacterium]
MSEKTENRLKDSTSPYLRSAAHQPIDWYEWGEEAFAKAQKEDKPMLLDIGAVWCHWCHVIDRESYENPVIAQIINEHFVPVKVDRDERPDVDSRYQAAISAISGQGGWPLTGFLMPDGKPFFGGTYFPPEDQFGRPGFRRVLLAVAESYKSKRTDLVRAAESLAEGVAQQEMFTGAHGKFDAEVVDSQVRSITQLFDIKNGGFGKAPKFPHCSAIDLVLERYQQTKERHLLAMAETTLEKMARGGVYDQLAGGFHRYSVDEKWLVPHFEKMSYDNSELLKNYLHAIGLARNENWEAPFTDTAQSIVLWVNEVLSDQENGGFYASQDADYSLDDDGDYFTWTLEEVRAVLTPEESRVIELYYDVEAHGEMHHNPAKNVLWIARGFNEIGETLRKAPDEIVTIKLRAESKMLKARLARPTPFVDKTMYVSWNAMFASAYLEAARVIWTGWIAQDCKSFAIKTLDRMLRETWTVEQGFAHRIGGPALRGSLDDQVFGMMALLDAYEATLDTKYFQAAQRTMDIAIEKYGDAEGGGFFDRASDAPAMGGLDVRRKPFQDSPTPGANSVAAMALTRMHAYTGEKKYYDWAKKALEAFAGIAPQFGMFAATYGLAATLFANHPIQVVITGAEGDDAAKKLEETANSVFRFGKAVLRIKPGMNAEHLPLALRETLPHLPADKANALVCFGNTCMPPTNDPDNLKALLLEQTGYSATST